MESEVLIAVILPSAISIIGLLVVVFRQIATDGKITTPLGDIDTSRQVDEVVKMGVRAVEQAWQNETVRAQFESKKALFFTYAQNELDIRGIPIDVQKLETRMEEQIAIWNGVFKRN